jgi:8-oxo-dGTP pyrophosphatase MutT (NUDIX family)
VKLPFELPTHGHPHRYCTHCFAAGTLKRHYLKRSADYFVCSKCGERSFRSIIHDPKVAWWTDEKGELWHESVGIFIVSDDDALLLFKRRLYPAQYSIPAGHTEVALSTEANARKELVEETGLAPSTLKYLAQIDVAQDQCMRGADSHRWHLYEARVTGRPSVTINYEGREPVWVSVAEAKNLDLAPAIRTLINQITL